MIPVMLTLSILLLAGAMVQPQEPSLLWREDWKVSPAEIPVTQDHVVNPDLVVALYGPGFAGIKKSHHDWIPNDPYYVWSGACPGNWLVTLRHKRGAIDLTGNARIRWRSKQSGFRELRIALRTEDGTWLVSTLASPETADWTESEFDLSKSRWRRLNIGRVTEEAWVDNPKLDRVVEIGFTDLASGGLTPASSRLDWIEVYGRWSK